MPTQTVRIATSEDVPAVQALAAKQDSRELTTIAGERYTLVLDAPDGGLAAAAQVTLEKPRGHLRMLAFAKRWAGEALEARMIAVARALCEAFGCDSLDVPSALRRAM